MRIVEVNPFFHPYDGGIEKRIYRAAKMFAEKGHETTVITGRLSPDDAEEEVLDGFRVIRLRSKQLRIYNPPFIKSYGVGETLDTLGADVVDYHYRWAPSYNKALAAYNGPKVFTYHNMWGEGGKYLHSISEKNDDSFARTTLSSFDHIISVSDYVRNDLISRGYSPGYVTAIPTGLDEEPRAGPGNGDYALFVGRLVRTKGLDVLVEAMRDVDGKVVICGKGPDRKHLQKRIAKAGVGDKIELRGFVPDDEREKLMGECRFFVMPSLFESFGLAAAEALAHGRPILCSDADGLPSTVGDAGYVVTKNDARALADALNIMFTDDGLVEDRASKAIQVARQYDWDIIHEKMTEVYGKVAQGEYTEKDAKR